MQPGTAGDAAQGLVRDNGASDIEAAVVDRKAVSGVTASLKKGLKQQRISVSGCKVAAAKEPQEQRLEIAVQAKKKPKGRHLSAHKAGVKATTIEQAQRESVTYFTAATTGATSARMS